MSKTLKELERIIDDYEKQLRKLDHVIMYNSSNKRVDFQLVKDKGLEEFLKDFLYYNHLLAYEKPGSDEVFFYTMQIKGPGSITAYKCYSNARRSVGDLFRLALEYYSDKVTLYDTMEAIYNIVQAGTRIKTKNGSYSGIVYMNICHGIHRRVFNLDIGSSERLTFRFDSKNGDYTETNYLDQEFPILGTDYATLFSTISGKSFLKRKREEGYTLQVTPQEELDRLVMEKLAKMSREKTRDLDNRLQPLYGALDF